MRKVLYVLMFCGMTALWTGCQSSTDAPKKETTPAPETTPTTDAQSNAGEATSSEFTLVKLKVPNMT